VFAFDLGAVAHQSCDHAVNRLLNFPVVDVYLETGVKRLYVDVVLKSVFMSS
jgi:hypothetical protein